MAFVTNNLFDEFMYSFYIGNELSTTDPMKLSYWMALMIIREC